MPALTAKSIWKLGLLAKEKAWNEDNPKLRYLIINKFGGINIGHKYRVCHLDDDNYAIVEINYIGCDTKPIIDIDKNRLDVIPFDDKDDYLIGCKCNKYKQRKLVINIFILFFAFKIFDITPFIYYH